MDFLQISTRVSKAKKIAGLGGTVQINQECRESEEERKEGRHRWLERRERQKGVDGVMEGDQQVQGN